MDAQDLIASTLLRFGDRVVVEHPCFPPLLDLLESLGVRFIGVPVDAQGLDVAACPKPSSPMCVQSSCSRAHTTRPACR